MIHGLLPYQHIPVAQHMDDQEQHQQGPGYSDDRFTTDRRLKESLRNHI
jgi:hypothetical protein